MRQSYRLSSRLQDVFDFKQALIREVVEWGTRDADVFAIDRALTEVLRNVRQHAYDLGEGPLEVTVANEDGVLTIDVDDEGCGVAPIDPEPATERGARGLYLAARFLDGLVITRNPCAKRGIRVRLVKRLAIAHDRHAALGAMSRADSGGT